MPPGFQLDKQISSIRSTFVTKSMDCHEKYYPDMEKKSVTGSKVESDADRGRSQSRQAHVDTTIGSNRRRNSPSSSSHVGVDEYRFVIFLNSMWWKIWLL